MIEPYDRPFHRDMARRARTAAMIAGVIWVSTVVIVIGFWIGIAAIAYHFIHKLW